MNVKIAAVKGLKALAYVLVGGIGATLVGPEFTDKAKELAESVVGSIPVVGTAVKGIASGLLIGGIAAVAAALDNIRKHLNTPVA